MRLSADARDAAPQRTVQLEYHATVFTASYLTPTATLMDALNFAQSPIGPSMNVNTSVNTINSKSTPKVYYNTTFAASFHTYKMVWTPTSVAWLVDKGARIDEPPSAAAPLRRRWSADASFPPPQLCTETLLMRPGARWASARCVH